MRSFVRVLTTSAFFGSSTPAFSSSAISSSTQFTNELRGPQLVDQTEGFAISGNFGGNGNPSSGTYGGLFNLLAGNTNEYPLMAVASSAFISSTGSCVFNVANGNFRYVDFQFIPSSANSSSGFVTVVFSSKGKM